MNVLKTLLAGAALAASAAGANAATYYADKVISSEMGDCYSNAGLPMGCAGVRSDTNNALGAANGLFYSMGFGGTLVVGFAQPLFDAANDVAAFEITYDREKGHDEAVDVYSVLGGVETYLGRLLNNVASSSVRATTAFEHIKLVDVTGEEFPNTSSNDGFDVDSVSIAAVPLPAAGLMLLAGLGGLAALRRRKTAA